MELQKLDMEWVSPNFDPIRTPWAHQWDILKKAANVPNYALFAEMGTGKSLAVIMIARYKMLMEKRPLRTLVLSPPVTIKNWKSEWQAASKINPAEIVPLLGAGKKRAADVTSKNKKTVIITNYETLLMKPVFDALIAWRPEIIIFDESHRAKNISAKRTKAAIALARVAKYRYILTGTPVLNTPMDLFAQFMLLDLGETFGENFRIFQGKYFYDKNAGMPPQKHFPDWRIRPKALEAITKQMEEKAVYVKKSDCLDLPPLLREVIKIELSPLQRRLYLEMARDFVTYVKEGACVANIALTKILRLSQIVSGFIALEGEDGQDRVEQSIKDNPRIDAVRSLLEDIPAPAKIIIWAAFRQNFSELRELCEKLKLAYVEIHGGIPSNQKFRNVDEFITNPDVRILIGHPGSGGIGINLVPAAYSIFYSRTFSLEHDLQAEARNYRGGSEIHEKVTRYDIIAEDTVDELIAARLAAKQDMSHALIKDLALEVAKGL